MSATHKDEKMIYVYADFLPYHNKLIGKLYASATKGREFYSFEYDSEWLLHAFYRKKDGYYRRCTM